MLGALFEGLESRSTGVVGKVPCPTAESVKRPEQWEIATSTATWNAIVCARQWGKTHCARIIARILLAAPQTRTIYGTLIRRNCKKLFWDPLIEGMIADGVRLDIRNSRGKKATNDNDLMLTLPSNGSFLQAVSISKMSDLKTIRGDQCDGFIGDEFQEPNEDVQRALLERIVPSMLGKRGGRAWVFGTVPEVEPSCFAEKLDDPKWRTFGHSEKKGTPPRPVWDNPFIPPENVDKINEEAGLHPGHPAYERETNGRRVRDPKSIAYEYTPGFNDYDPREGPDWRGVQHVTGWGLDLGFGDCDAIVIGRTDPRDRLRTIRVLWSWAMNHLDVFDIAYLVECVAEVLPPGAIVGDHASAGGGKKTLETISAVLGMAMDTKPGDVMTNLGFVNDDLRSGRLLLPTVDLWTDKIAAVARRRFAAEPRKIYAVLVMLGVAKDECRIKVRELWPDGDPKRARLLEAIERDRVNLGKELQTVVKSVNPRTGKLEINKRGKHSDASEACRYMRHGLVQVPAPAIPVDTRSDDDKRRDEITRYLNQRQQARSAPAWRR